MNFLSIRSQVVPIFQKAANFLSIVPPNVRLIIQIVATVFARFFIIFAAIRILYFFLNRRIVHRSVQQIPDYIPRNQKYLTFNTAPPIDKPSSDLDLLLKQIQDIKRKIVKKYGYGSSGYELKESEKRVHLISDQIKKQSSLGESQTLQDLQDKLNIELINYVDVFSQHLTSVLKDSYGFYNLKYKEIFQHALALCYFMQEHSTCKPFIYECLCKINLSLKEVFFISRSQKTPDYGHLKGSVALDPIFKICDTHYQFIENLDPTLAGELKIKCANLPVSDKIDRQKTYPKIYLSNKEQLKILIKRLDRDENEYINFLTNKISNNQLKRGEKPIIEKRLAKLIRGISGLSPENLKKLRQAASQLLGINDEGRLDAKLDDIIARSKNTMGYSKNPTDSLEECAERLSWNCKIKTFFYQQKSLSEDEIQIPTWYHCTKTDDVFKKIVFGNSPVPPCILVKQVSGRKGAFVSNTPEIHIYGQFGVVLTSQITKERDVLHTNDNWRGLQKPILLYGQPNSAALFYVPRAGIGKTTKRTCQSEFKKKFGHKILFSSTEVIKFMREIVSQELGLPNLPLSWFFKDQETMNYELIQQDLRKYNKFINNNNF